MMHASRNRLFYLICVALLAACASAPQVVQIPVVAQSARPALNLRSDYAQTLAAIASVMLEDLKLPPVDGAVTFYPNTVALEAALVSEFQSQSEEFEKQQL